MNDLLQLQLESNGTGITTWVKDSTLLNEGDNIELPLFIESKRSWRIERIKNQHKSLEEIEADTCDCFQRTTSWQHPA
jgi:hypothetical protein